MSVLIRRAAPGDEGVLSALAGETFTDKFGHLYDPKDLAAFLASSHSVEAYARILADPQRCAWLAEARPSAAGPDRGPDRELGEAVGYGVAGRCDLPAPEMPDRAGAIDRLYFKASHQGGGHGQLLFAIMLDWLADAGFDPVYLSVYQDNEGAIRFYRRNGFEICHSYEYMVGDHADPEYLMVRGG